MTANFDLLRMKSALLVIDVQEESFGRMERPCEILYNMQQAVQGFQILGLPIYITEQDSKQFGSTIKPLKDMLGSDQVYWDKTTFSCINDQKFKEMVLTSTIEQWVLIGIEAHISILQTAKGLLRAHKKVVVLNDAITSKSIYDFSTSIAELRDVGVRISSTETVLFELLEDSRSVEFQEISALF